MRTIGPVPRIDIRVFGRAIVRLFTPLRQSSGEGSRLCEQGRGQRNGYGRLALLSAKADNGTSKDPDFNPGSIPISSPLRRCALALCFAALCLPLRAQTIAPTIDREAVYAGALPAYGYDAGKPLAVRTAGTQALGTARFLRFSYLSTNGQRVPALLFTPQAASRTHPVPCLVLLHGLGGSKEMLAGMALFAAKAGYASLLIDEYGQGARALGGKRPATPDAQAAELARTVRQTTVDVRRGLDYLGTRPDVDGKRIGLAGVSLGAIIGTVAAGVEPRIKATALISGGGDWPVILQNLAAKGALSGGRGAASVKGLDWDKLGARLAPVDPVTFAPHIAPRALLVIGGRKDTTTVPQATQEVYAAAGEPKEMHWFAQYGHVPPPEVVYPLLKAFFAARL